MKNARFISLLFVLQLSLFASGCKWSIVSVTGPNGVSTGQTITIYITGTTQTEENSPTLYGLILQIPNSWEVLSATATTTDGYSYILTENAHYASLYTPEPGHKIWTGTATESSDGTTEGTATVQLLVGNCTGQVRIKAAAGSYRNEAWTTDDPSGEFNFANITEQKYVHSVDCCAWRKQSPPSPLNHLKGVWGTSASNVFAVGANGTILHYDGNTWSSTASGTTNNLNGIWGSSGNYVFAVGANGTIVHYNGTAWTSMTSGTTSNLNGVWGRPGYGVFTVGDNQNTILRYIGDIWASTTLPSYCSSEELFSVWGGTADEVFAVGNFRSFFRYTGTYWNCTQLFGGNMYGIWGSSSSDVFAVGEYINEFWEDHPIAHYDGYSWSAMANETTNSLYGVWGTSASNVFAVGANGTILRYNGTAWSSMASDTTTTLRGVWGSSGSDVFAVGDDGTILHYGPPIDIYVDTDEQCGGLNPCYSTIQTAINAAKDGDAIKVRKGTYEESPTNSTGRTVTISGGWKEDFTGRDGITSMYAPRATGGGGVKVLPNVNIIAPQ